MTVWNSPNQLPLLTKPHTYLNHIDLLPSIELATGNNSTLKTGDRIGRESKGHECIYVSLLSFFFVALDTICVQPIGFMGERGNQGI